RRLETRNTSRPPVPAPLRRLSRPLSRCCAFLVSCRRHLETRNTLRPPVPASLWRLSRPLSRCCAFLVSCRRHLATPNTSPPPVPASLRRLSRPLSRCCAFLAVLALGGATAPATGLSAGLPWVLIALAAGSAAALLPSPRWTRRALLATAVLE